MNYQVYPPETVEKGGYVQTLLLARSVPLLDVEPHRRANNVRLETGCRLRLYMQIAARSKGFRQTFGNLTS
jgi:hypothetical protein